MNIRRWLGSKSTVSPDKLSEELTNIETQRFVRQGIEPAVRFTLRCWKVTGGSRLHLQSGIPIFCSGTQKEPERTGKIDRVAEDPPPNGWFMEFMSNAFVLYYIIYLGGFNDDILFHLLTKGTKTFWKEPERTGKIGRVAEDPPLNGWFMEFMSNAFVLYYIIYLGCLQ
ncbi:hypothetical protein CEXT_507331 [Caerostris extrusa]|uniref:Uncharacterized protein n=1 Tax=Caerostris extrusa TaxID=172846 RepID=A0AAV4M758_CAEEX|nr:hypothetical protein CEXT_507331 [Caerostris extrusa]